MRSPGSPRLVRPPISAAAMLPPPMNASLRMLIMCVFYAPPDHRRRISPCRCAPASRPRQWPLRSRRSSPSTVYRASSPARSVVEQVSKPGEQRLAARPDPVAVGGCTSGRAACRRGKSAICCASSNKAPGSTPLLVGSGTRATWMHALSGGAWKGRWSDRRRATLHRSTECTQSKCSAIARVLFDCRDPMKCQRTGSPSSSPEFAKCLLQIVFAEIRDARRGGKPHRFGSLGLGNRDQCDGGGIASGGPRGPVYRRPDVVHVKRQILRTN